jgi:hypothetical protein
MFIKKIAGFTLIAILLNLNNCFAQDTVFWTRGLRIGCDLSRFALPELQPDRKALEFSFDTEFKNNKFVVIELGNEQVKTENDRLTYQSKGYYGRLGMDFNILKRDKLEKGRDIVFVGFRYGYCNINQQVNKFVTPSFFPKDTVWGSFPSANLYGHWLEVAFGIKVEVLKNLFLGTSLRGRVMLFSKKDINYPNFMSGFGNGANPNSFGLNYTVSYQIPLMKVAPKKVVKKVQPRK